MRLNADRAQTRHKTNGRQRLVLYVEQEEVDRKLHRNCFVEQNLRSEHSYFSSFSLLPSGSLW